MCINRSWVSLERELPVLQLTTLVQVLSRNCIEVVKAIIARKVYFFMAEVFTSVDERFASC